MSSALKDSDTTSAKSSRRATSHRRPPLVRGPSKARVNARTTAASSTPDAQPAAPSLGERLWTRVRRNLREIAQQSQHLTENWLNQHLEINQAQFSAMSDMLGSFRNIAEQMALHPLRVVNKDAALLREHMSLLNHVFKRGLGETNPALIEPERGDRRFNDPEWSKNLLFSYLKQAYLLNTKAVLELVDTLEGSPEHNHEQLLFYTRQLLSALSPSNFLFTNPEALKRTWSTHGTNLLDGFKNFWMDFKRSPNLINVAMTDFSAFEVGTNLATTPGQVVFQNDLMQLIQYQPTTSQVHKTPLLVIPPWINKFYILDLKEKNSLIKWLVDQGHTVFVVSWVNPGPALRHKDFSDYLTEGALAALDAIEAATGETAVNAMGYCIGGTLLACLLSWLAEKGQSERVKSATYLTTLLDFADPGDIGVLISPQSIRGIEKQLDKQGYYDGRAMAFSFNLLRENDLIWSFVVNNYLKGERPTAFDLLYWNSDCTNLPAAMHRYYLRNMYLDNKLVEPGGIQLAGVNIDLEAIQTPVYFLSCIQDHIARWKGTYRGTHLHAGEVTFVLSGSGHIAGVVNPPTQEKYGYWTHAALPDDPDDWYREAEKHAGSWWPHWNQWAQAYAGDWVEPRMPGEGGLPALEPAPGSYVRQKVNEVIAA